MGKKNENDIVFTEEDLVNDDIVFTEEDLIDNKEIPTVSLTEEEATSGLQTEPEGVSTLKDTYKKGAELNSRALLGTYDQRPQKEVFELQETLRPEYKQERKFTEQQLKDIAIQTNFSYPERLRNSFIQGLSPFISEASRNIGIMAKKIEDELPKVNITRGLFTDDKGNVQFNEKKSEDYATYQFADWLDKTVKDYAPTDSDMQKSIAGQLTQGAGSLAGFVLAARTGRALNLGKLGSAGLTAATGAAINGGMEYKQAKEMTEDANTLGEQEFVIKYGGDEKLYQTYVDLQGKDPDKVGYDVFQGAALIGSAEALPVASFFRRLDKFTGGAGKKYIGNSIGKLVDNIESNRLGRMALGGVEEGAQEAISQFLTNANANEIYDKSREYLDGVFESGNIGGILGLTLNAFIGGGRKAARLNPDKADEINAAVEHAEKLASKLNGVDDEAFYKAEESPKVVKLKEEQQDLTADISSLPQEQKSIVENRIEEINGEIEESKKEEIASEKNDAVKEAKIKNLEGTIASLDKGIEGASEATKKVFESQKNKLVEQLNAIKNEKQEEAIKEEGLLKDALSEKDEVKEPAVETSPETETGAVSAEAEKSKPTLPQAGSGGVGGDVKLGNNTIIADMSLPFDSGVNTGLVKNSKGAVYHDKNTAKFEKLGYSKEQIDKLSQVELDEILAKNIENPNVETSAKMPLAEKQTTTQEFLNEADKEGGRFSELAKALKQFFGIDGVETEIVKGLKDFFGKNNDGDYANNKIRIDEKAKNKLQTFLHEAIHKVTVDKILQFERGDYSKLSKQDIEAIQNLTRIFNESKVKIHEFLGGGKGDRTKGHYGFTNVHEFISEAFTNPEFQSLLRNLPTEGKNPTIFKQFLDAVAKFLGLKDASILNDIFYHTENLREQSIKETTKAESNVEEGSGGVGGDVGKRVSELLDASLKKYNSSNAKQKESLKQKVEENNKYLEGLIADLKGEDVSITNEKGELVNTSASLKEQLEAGKQFLKEISTSDEKGAVKESSSTAAPANEKNTNLAKNKQNESNQNTQKSQTNGEEISKKSNKDVSSITDVSKALEEVHKKNPDELFLPEIYLENNPESFVEKANRGDEIGNVFQTRKYGDGNILRTRLKEEGYKEVNFQDKTHQQILDILQKEIDRGYEPILFDKQDQSIYDWRRNTAFTDKMPYTVLLRPENIKSKSLYESVSEAYHKAKKDGTNPELVEAVEQSLKETTKAETPTTTKESNVVEGSGGVGGDVPQFAAKSEKHFEYVPIEEVDAYKEFDRETDKKFDKKELDDLTDDIRKNGIKKPIQIKVDRNGKALIVEGNTRLAAAKRLGIKNIPVEIIEGEFGSINKDKAKSLPDVGRSELQRRQQTELGLKDNNGAYSKGFTRVEQSLKETTKAESTKNETKPTTEKPVNTNQKINGGRTDERITEISKEPTQEVGGGTKTDTGAGDIKTEAGKTKAPSLKKADELKTKLKEAKDKAKEIRSTSGVAEDPFKKAKKQAQADREVLDAYVNLAKHYISEGIKTIEEFAKELGSDIDDAIKNAWKVANGEGKTEDFVKEPEVKERAFAKQIINAEDLRTDVREGLSEDAKNYIPKTNELSQKEALAIIEAKGEQETLDMIKDLNNGMKPSVRVFIGENLIKRYNKTDIKKAVETAEFLSEYATELGQGVQAFQPFSALTPEGQLLYVQKEVKRIREKQIEKAKPKIDRAAAEMRGANKEAIAEVLNVVDENISKAKDGTLAKKSVRAKQKKDLISALRKEYFQTLNDASRIAQLAVDKRTIQLAKLVLEDVADDFKAFSKQIMSALGKEIFPHLKSIYLDAGGKKAIGDVDKEVARAIKELDIDVKELVTKHYTEYDAAKKSLTDKLVKDAGMTQEDAEVLSKQIQDEFEKVADKKKKQLLKRKLQNKVVNKKRNQELYEKLIELSNLGAFSDKEFTKAYAEKAGFANITEEQAKKIIDLANKIQEAPEGMQKFRATEDLLKYQENIKGVNWGEVAQSVWYANVLSGYSTQVVNTVANIYNTATLLGVASVKNPFRTPILAKALVNGWVRGIYDAADVLKTGYSPIRGKVEIPNILERVSFKGGKFNPYNYAKYVQRIMNAADTFAYEGLKEMRAYEMAEKEARKKGRSTISKETWQYVNEKMFNTKERIEDARAQAKDEGFTGIDYKRRVFEILEQSRPPEMVEDSKHYAARGTFNYQPEGTIGLATNWVNQLTDAVEIKGVRPLKFIVPFTRIIGNVTNNALDYTPYGFGRAAKGSIGIEGYSKRSKTAYRKFTPEQQREAIIKASLGTVMMAALYALTQPDDEGKSEVEITGAGTGDFKKDYELKQTGWQPYSLRIGDTWYSYKETPFVLSLSLLGNYRDNIKYKGASEEDALDSFAYSASSTANLLSDMTFLGSATDFVSSLSSGDANKLGTYLKTKGRSTLKGFVVPNLYTQAAKEVEIANNQALKDPKTTVEYLMQDIPVARNSQNDKINSLGEPVLPDTDRLTSEREKDPVWNYIVENRAWIGKPNQKASFIVDGDIERPMNDDEYYEFIKLSGKYIREGVEELMKEDLEKSEIKKAVNRIKENSRRLAKEELFSKNIN